MMLEIKNLTVKVKNNASILRGVSLSIDEGTCIGLTGASGSGKTTLIKSIMGMNGGDLEVPQGKILLDGDDLLKRSAKERRGLCGKTIGFIPQNPMTAFFHTQRWTGRSLKHSVCTQVRIKNRLVNLRKMCCGKSI